MADYKDDYSTYGKTITIKYYVNNRLKPQTQVFINGVEKTDTYIKWPLYVLVNVKRQPTQFKSMLGLDIALDQLDETLLSHSKMVELEKKLITLAVLASKPFEANDFNIKNAINLYKELAKDYGLIIEKYLRIVFYETLKQCGLDQVADEDKDVNRAFEWIDDGFGKIHLTDHTRVGIYNSMFEYGFNTGPFSVDSNYNIDFWVNYLRRYIPSVQELYDRLGPAIWKIKKYCESVKAYKQWDIVSIDDWNNGDFDSAFIEFYKQEAKYKALDELHVLEGLRMLKDGVKALRDYKPELNRLLSLVE